MKAIQLRNNVWRVLGSAACLGLLLLGPVHVLAQDSTSSTKPTASQTPQQMDQAWQKASAKYDETRKTLLTDVDRIVNAGPYRPDWESLRQYETPDWYKDAKFGIFIHWGVYSVPAFGSEWYPRMMYQEGSDEYKHHLATYGPPSTFGYKDFIPRFKAEHFDPVQWAELFKASGAKYVVPVFEHHDGFAMYDSGLSDWTVAKMGPHRDMYGELAKALRERGLRLGASSHRIEHNFFLEGGRKIDSDVNDPRYLAFYGPAHTWLDGHKTMLQDWTYLSNEYLDDWLARGVEIVEKYEPDIIYFDWWIGQPDARRHVAKFASFYYNHAASQGKVPVINYKDSALEEHSAVLDIERGQLSGIRPLYWQTDTSISNKSWGYIENDNFKSAETVVHQLVDIVSKNGNLLVNVGPRSDGTIPEEVQAILRDIGSWLKVNGEAIYSTRAWTKFGEGPTTIVEGAFHDTDTKSFTAQDFRFTAKGNSLFAIELAWPESGEAVIHSLNDAALSGQNIVSISLLSQGSPLTYQLKSDGLYIQLPPQKVGSYAYSFKIEFQKPPTVRVP
ncbi:MAG TPA: alpha-L-fucosidase [Candidatus Acidoferrum sp.]|nr:alpha-L-fucosidase [Candidatus Acidoferrum sp.]